MATATPGLPYGGPGDVRNIHTIRQKKFYRSFKLYGFRRPGIYVYFRTI